MNGKIYCSKECLSTKTYEGAMERSFRLRQLPEFRHDLDFTFRDSNLDHWRTQRFQAMQRIMARKDMHCTCAELIKKKKGHQNDYEIISDNYNFSYCSIHMTSRANDYWIIHDANRRVPSGRKQRFQAGFFVFSI